MEFSKVFSTIHIRAETQTFPDITLNLETREANLFPGQEFVVDVELVLLAAGAWSLVSFDLFYDTSKIEIIPYRICEVWGEIVWMETSPIPWMAAVNPQVLGNNGHVRVILQTPSHNATSFIPTMTMRFRVLDYADAGETLIKWTPASSGSFVINDRVTWQMTSLFFAEPTIETYAHIMISPHLGFNLESRVENAHPGDEILVDIELSLLAELGWNIVYLDVFYDRTRLELVPYLVLPHDIIDVGSNPNDPWRLVGGDVISNPELYQGYGDIWATRILFISTSGDAISHPATVTLRFRVRCDAPVGDALVTWSPAPFGAASEHNGAIVPMRYSLPTSGSFASVAINP